MTSFRFRSETIAEAIARTQAHSRGFDYLRIVLSLGVLVWHSARVCYPNFGMGAILRPTAGLILPMFFALSGFLVSGSLLRSKSIHEFVALRAIRLIPALAIETVLSLLVIGALFTTLPIGQFFSDTQTLRYFLNIIGVVQFQLPGVFKDHPLDAVNLSLWTVPFELECYLLVVILWITRILRRRILVLMSAIALQVAIPMIDLYRNELLDPTRPVSGRMLVLAFLCGVVVFQYRDQIPLRLSLFVTAVVASTACLLIGPLTYAVCIPAAYITVYLGMLNPQKIPVIMDGDYSYGIYLYAFPIQQAVFSLSPVPYRVWWVNASVSMILVGLCAAFSWHIVEKPILNRRKVLVRFLDNFVGRFERRNRSVGNRQQAIKIEQ